MEEKVFTPRVILQMLLLVILVPLLPLIVSGRWDWWEAWVFAGVCIIGFAVSRLLAARRHPDLIAERARMFRHEDALGWDKLLAPLVGLGGALIPLTAGLDEWLGWSPAFSLPVKIVALVVILASFTLSSYALVENRFFSGMVRIQQDRGQQVVTGGPYRWMRHPGYAGALAMYLASPLFLDSAWMYIPVAFLSIVLILRTALEDRTLQERLPGYTEYSKRVRFRLIPGIW
jgi:protein-S-isoprenylcysteine O-methyltransferase Ste14